MYELEKMRETFMYMLLHALRSLLGRRTNLLAADGKTTREHQTENS